MSALAALLGNDVRVLYRTGYIWASLAVFALLLLVALQASRLDFAGYEELISALILFDVVLSPVMLVGLMLLLERSEGAYASLTIAPASRWAYLAARAATVTLLSVFEMGALVLIVYDGALSPFVFGLGLVGAALLAAFTGFVVAAPFDTLYRFVLPMVFAILFLGAPGYAVWLGAEPAWLAWHPTAGALVLIEQGFGAGDRGELVIAVVSMLAWLAAAAWLARSALRHIDARVGGA